MTSHERQSAPDLCKGDIDALYGDWCKFHGFRLKETEILAKTAMVRAEMGGKVLASIEKSVSGSTLEPERQLKTICQTGREVLEADTAPRSVPQVQNKAKATMQKKLESPFKMALKPSGM